MKKENIEKLEQAIKLFSEVVKEEMDIDGFIPSITCTADGFTDVNISPTISVSKIASHKKWFAYKRGGNGYFNDSFEQAINHYTDEAVCKTSTDKNADE